MFDITRLGQWHDLPFFHNELKHVEADLENETAEILPPISQVFAALELCQPKETRVVILGQDPYPTPGHAHGLAFSAEPHVTPLPRSLANIYRELADDIGARPKTADLRPWAEQGVLLLNTALTVRTGEAGSHLKIGWQALVKQVLSHIDPVPHALLLWGKPAQKTAQVLKNPQHLRIETAHPSPLSAHRGFFGSRPFTAVNKWLEAQGSAPITWA